MIEDKIRQWKAPRYISEPKQVVVTKDHMNRKSYQLLKNGNIGIHDIKPSDISKIVLNWMDGVRSDKMKPVVFRHEGKEVLIIYNK